MIAGALIAALPMYDDQVTYFNGLIEFLHGLG